MQENCKLLLISNTSTYLLIMMGTFFYVKNVNSLAYFKLIAYLCSVRNDKGKDDTLEYSFQPTIF